MMQAVTLSQVGEKKGLVDIKLKDDVTTFARDFREMAKHHLVVILSGHTYMHSHACARARSELVCVEDGHGRR